MDEVKEIEKKGATWIRMQNNTKSQSTEAEMPKEASGQIQFAIFGS